MDIKISPITESTIKATAEFVCQHFKSYSVIDKNLNSQQIKELVDAILPKSLKTSYIAQQSFDDQIVGAVIRIDIYDLFDFENLSTNDDSIVIKYAKAVETFLSLLSHKYIITKNGSEQIKKRSFIYEFIAVKHFSSNNIKNDDVLRRLTRLSTYKGIKSGYKNFFRLVTVESSSCNPQHIILSHRRVKWEFPDIYYIKYQTDFYFIIQKQTSSGASYCDLVEKRFKKFYRKKKTYKITI
jgi:hypothetical protein